MFNVILATSCGAAFALTAWTCGYITRVLTHTIRKDDCDC